MGEDGEGRGQEGREGGGKGDEGEKRKVILLNHSCIHRLNTKEYKGSHENHK